MSSGDFLLSLIRKTGLAEGRAAKLVYRLVVRRDFAGGAFRPAAQYKKFTYVIENLHTRMLLILCSVSLGLLPTDDGSEQHDVLFGPYPSD